MSKIGTLICPSFAACHIARCGSGAYHRSVADSSLSATVQPTLGPVVVANRGAPFLSETRTVSDEAASNNLMLPDELRRKLP
jgi:hypothetical protein